MHYYHQGSSLTITGSFRIITEDGVISDLPSLRREGGLHSEALLISDFIRLVIRVSGDDGSEKEVIEMIICSLEGLSDTALRELRDLAAEARSAVMRERSSTDYTDITVVSEGSLTHNSAQKGTPAGKKVWEAIHYGLSEVLTHPTTESFFVFSQVKGEWLTWTSTACPYYPCHFTDQSCTFCYCPYYPCGNSTLGAWIKRRSGSGRVWNCSDCTLLHEPKISEYSKRHPESPLSTLIDVYNALDAQEKKGLSIEITGRESQEH